MIVSVILYNVKINSGINKYPDWFKIIYMKIIQNKVKHTLL